MRNSMPEGVLRASGLVAALVLASCGTDNPQEGSGGQTVVAVQAPAASGAPEPAAEPTPDQVERIEGTQLQYVRAMLPSDLVPADARQTSYGYSIATFTPDGGLAMRGDGPYVRITAGIDPDGPGELPSASGPNAEPRMVQGMKAVLLVDDSTDPKSLDLPESMDGFENPWISLVWVDSSGISLAVQGRGVAVDDLATLAEGVSYVG